MCSLLLMPLLYERKDHGAWFPVRSHLSLQNRPSRSAQEERQFLSCSVFLWLCLLQPLTLGALLLSLEMDVVGRCGACALCLPQRSLGPGTRDCAPLLSLLGKRRHKMRRLSGGFSLHLLLNNFATFRLIQTSCLCFSVLKNCGCVCSGMRENAVFEAAASDVQWSSVSRPLPVGRSQHLSGMTFWIISEIQNTIFPFFRFLCLIDYYESQISQMKKELR